jgi:glutamine synthetase type III
MGCSNSTAKNSFPSDTIAMYDVPASPPPSAPEPSNISFAQNTGMYGLNRFQGNIAKPYLVKQGLKGDELEGPWNRNPAVADKVAKAVVAWAKDRGALHHAGLGPASPANQSQGWGALARQCSAA